MNDFRLRDFTIFRKSHEYKRRTKQWDKVSISPIFYEQIFCMKDFCKAFVCLQLGFVIFWQKDFGAKAVNKMLVKLTQVSHMK